MQLSEDRAKLIARSIFYKYNPEQKNIMNLQIANSLI